MARLLLLRHGQSEWNAASRWQGWADPPLTAAGEAESLAAVDWLREVGLSGVVSSDLVRARRTAEIVAGALGLGEVVVEPGLRERDVGDWSGHSHEEIQHMWPGQLELWREGRLDRPPNGEGQAEFTDRVMEVVSRLAVGPGVLLVVSHGGVIHAVGRALQTEWRGNPNLCGRWVEEGLLPGERAGNQITPTTTTIL
jgi:probable phosphoglycerate mutase